MSENTETAAEIEAFESGYTEEQTETPVAQEPEEKAEPAVVAEATPTVDPIKELMARLDKFESSQNKLAGHIGGMQQNQKEIQERLAAGNATRHIADAPTAAQIAEAAKNPQEWDRLKEDFEEWATATEKFVDHKLANLRPNLDSQAIETIVSQRVANETAALKSSIRYDNAVDKLTDLHPDFMSIRETPAFIAWRDAMPEEERSKFNNSVDPRYVGQKLSEFKASIKKPSKPTPPQTNRFAAAVNPRSAGGFSQGKSDDDDFEAGYKSN